MKSSPDISKGFLIIAQGKSRYIKMAENIAMSLRLTNPNIPLALVTDSKEGSLKQLYDFVIPVKEDLGVGFIQKVCMYDYSPFQRTIFIDVDCLVIRNLDFLWDLFKGEAVSVLGKKVYDGDLLGVKVHTLLERFKIPNLLTFNGGVYYFEKSEQAEQIFKKALDIFQNEYDSLGLIKFNGRPGDEPVMSIAMSIYGVEPKDDHGKGMYTPVGQAGVFKMDSMKGICEFYKYGKLVMPAIMHFGGGYPEAFHYRRESLKIRIAYKAPFLKPVLSPLVNSIFNPPYIAFVFCYRILKTVFRRQSFRLTPVMPMFRFE